ncbi:MAG: hypothetical protein ACRDYW_06375 [Acidimicrobiales bacterium]
MGTSWRRPAIAALLLVTACGGDDDTVGGSATDSTTVTSTAAGEKASDWCDELTALEQSEDVVLTSDDIVGAPEVIRAPLETLVDFGELDPTSAPPGSLERGIRAVAAIESWGHQHCGGDHPFCSLWISVSGAMAAPAFVEEAQQDEANDQLISLLDQLEEVLMDVAPPEVRDDVETLLAWFSRASDGTEMSEEDERAGEAASAALDEWAWSERCEGATEPDDE